jgi:MFS transporter, ACS family, glucarate transporter
MNMLGNLGGFAAPLIGGIILDHTNQNWSMVLYVMSGMAFVSALCWLFLEPDAHR